MHFKVSDLVALGSFVGWLWTYTKARKHWAKWLFGIICFVSILTSLFLVSNNEKITVDSHTVEDVKGNLTIDGKPDEAIVVQNEIDKTQKKYAVNNLTEGSDAGTQDLHGATDRNLPIPAIADGLQVGLTGLNKRAVRNLMEFDGPQVTIGVADSDAVVSVDATDLSSRIERKEKGVSEGDGKEAEQERKSTDALGRIWHVIENEAPSWSGQWVRREESLVFDAKMRSGDAKTNYVVIVTFHGISIYADRVDGHVRLGQGSNSYTYVGIRSGNTVIGRTSLGDSSNSWSWSATIEY